MTAGAADKAPLVSADDPALDPFEINFLPELSEGRGPRAPYTNSHGVVIGDHEYESANSPLSNWTEDTDPAIMAGDEWVHPYKDIGFLTDENRDYFERGIAPAAGIFMHPDKNTSYAAAEADEPDRAE
ncbi:DUF3905 domain-containing protein [Paenibacillus aurantiacus]|uniref:DUF3905 domain-containing protein n=1 Tax=Paenibacillus aurantiacus TaxID=1936118 RepID=A0ABV5KHQ9_9BACL